MTEVAPMELPDVLPARHPDVDVAEFETAFVVFDSRVRQVHLLTGAGALVFDACDGVTPSSVLVDELTDAGVGAAEAVSAIIGGMLGQLAGLGLLEGTEPPPPPPPCLGCGGTATAQRWRWFRRR